MSMLQMRAPAPKRNQGHGGVVPCLVWGAYVCGALDLGAGADSVWPIAKHERWCWRRVAEQLPLLSERACVSSYAELEASAAVMYNADHVSASIWMAHVPALRGSARRCCLPISETQRWSRNDWFHMGLRDVVPSSCCRGGVASACLCEVVERSAM